MGDETMVAPLAKSERETLKYLYPLFREGQDAHTALAGGPEEKKESA